MSHRLNGKGEGVGISSGSHPQGGGVSSARVTPRVGRGVGIKCEGHPQGEGGVSRVRGEFTP